MNYVSINKNGTQLLCTDDDKQKRNYADLIDLQTGKIIRTFNLKYQLEDYYNKMKLHPDSKTVAFLELNKVKSESRYGEDEKYYLRVYDVATGKLKWEHHDPELWGYNNMAYTHDGKYLTAILAYSHDSKNSPNSSFVVLDNETGREIRRFLIDKGNGNELSPRNICFSPDGQILAYSSNDYVFTYSFSSGQLLRKFSPHTELIWNLSFSSDGKMIASCGGGQIFIQDTLTGEMIQTIGKGASTHQVVEGMTISDDDSVVVMVCSGMIKVFHGTTGILQKEWRAFNGKFISLSLRRDGTVIKVVSEDEDDKETRQTVWWDVAKGEQITPLNIPKIEMKTYWNQQTKDAPRVVTSPNGNYRAEFEIVIKDPKYPSSERTEILNLTNLQTKKTIKIPVRGVEKHSFYNHPIEFTEDSNYLVTYERNSGNYGFTNDQIYRIIYIDVKTGQVAYEIIESSQRFHLDFNFALTKTGDLLVSCYKSCPVRWDIQIGGPVVKYYTKGEQSDIRNIPHNQKTGEIYPDCICEDIGNEGTQWCISGNEKFISQQKIISKNLRYFSLWSISDSKLIKSFYLTVPHLIGALCRLDEMILNEDGSEVVCLTDNPLILHVVDIHQENLIRSINLPTPKEKDGFRRSSDTSVLRWKDGTESEVEIFCPYYEKTKNNTATTVPMVVYTVDIRTEKVQTKEDNKDNFPREIMKDIWDKKTGKKVLTRHFFNGGQDWLFFTPEGLFDGTPAMRQLMTYRVGQSMNVQPVEAFFQDFYYPGLLQEVLQGGRPLPTATLKNQIPPDIAFISPKSGAVDSDQVTIEVEITDQGGGIQEPAVSINGIGIYVAEPPVTKGKTMRWKFPLQIAKGTNNIVVKSATADGQIACESQPLQMTYRNKTVEAPSFYVLTVGVSDYSTGTMSNLPCAKPDAEVLGEVLKRRGEQFYGKGKVHLKTLIDSQATKAGIKQALAEFAKEANTDDVFLLSLAGHGQTVGKRYFFIPYEFKGARENELADDAVRAQGVPGDELQDWINAIAARKRIIIYDTCQSGAAITRSGVDQRVAMEAFRKATGCFSIAAAGGSEAALELPDVGHGALTYALLAGLGEAEKGILKTRNAASTEGIVNVRDWLLFAQDQVPNLTRMSFGTEQPVQFVSGENNFPILSVGKE